MHIEVQMFYAACKAVERRCPEPWAKALAQAGQKLVAVDKIADQATGILLNTTSWRGNEANKIKNILRKCQKLGR